MRHNVLTYTFVGVWTSPLPGVPRFKQEFLVSLFGEPFTTTIGIGNAGLTVQKLGPPPQPVVAFGPVKFQVQHTSIQEAAKVVGVLIHEANSAMSQQIPLLSAVGLNTEHEWIKPTFKPSNRWLAGQYVTKGLSVGSDGAVAEAINLQFRLLLANPARSYNIQLQPRADKDDAVFAAINDHRDWNKAVPTVSEVEGLLKASLDEIDNRVTPIILGGVADV